MTKKAIVIDENFHTALKALVAEKKKGSMRQAIEEELIKNKDFKKKLDKVK